MLFYLPNPPSPGCVVLIKPVAGFACTFGLSINASMRTCGLHIAQYAHASAQYLAKTSVTTPVKPATPATPATPAKPTSANIVFDICVVVWRSFCRWRSGNKHLLAR